MCQETIDPTDNASDPQPIAPRPQPTPNPQPAPQPLYIPVFFLFISTRPSSSPHAPPPPYPSGSRRRRRGGLGGRGSHPLLRGAPRPAVTAARLRAGPLGAPPPAPPCAARRAAAAAASPALRPPRAPCPPREAPGGAALPYATAAGGGPGPEARPHSGGLDRGAGERALPTCGHPPRAVRPAWEPGCSGEEAAGVRKARGNRCLTSADGINSRAAERGSPAAKSQEREREGASGGQRRAKSTGPRRGRPTP